MSYLDTPRFHFLGKFFANPSTINNATENYNPAEVYNNNPPSAANPNSVWWNQMGQAFFKPISGSVQSGIMQDGTILQSGADPFIGATIAPRFQGALNQYGKLVDLDPDQQARSMVVGMSIQIATTDAQGNPQIGLTGDVRAMVMLDVWGRVTGGGGGGIETAGAMYQSVLENIQWYGVSQSKFLAQLNSVSPQTLSFKFALDGYNGVITSDQFATGRMTGAIGPYVSGEPVHFVAKRRMFAQNWNAVPAPGVANSPMNAAPFQINGSTLTIDLSNSVPTSAVHAGPFVDLGIVSVVIDPAGSNIAVTPPLFSTAAQYTAQYQNFAGIFQLDLGQNAHLASQKMIGIGITAPSAVNSAVSGIDAGRLKEGLTLAQIGVTPIPVSGTTLALSENTDGIFVDVDLNSIRLENGAPAWSSVSVSGTDITSNGQIGLWATQYGVPAPNLTVNFQVAPNAYQFPDSQGNPKIINNDPLSAVSWPTSVVTDANGRAMLNFTANGLQAGQKPAEREFVDGQLYLFSHDYTMDGVQPITLLVFENIPSNANPTWWQDVYPILFQYARLYPFMRSLIDLSDYSTMANPDIARKIQGALSLPLTDAAYMPVTRDLSVGKTNLILTWIRNGMPEGTKPSAAS